MLLMHLRSILDSVRVFDEEMMLLSAGLCKPQQIEYIK